MENKVYHCPYAKYKNAKCLHPDIVKLHFYRKDLEELCGREKLYFVERKTKTHSS